MGGDLPANLKINILKLYLSLGTNIDQTVKDGPNIIDIVMISLHRYHLLDDSDYKNSDEEPLLSPEEKYFIPDKKHRADDIIKPHEVDVFYFKYFRTPVTYWLEEFIAAGYPASMLDTHSLHYPRYMKDASVAQVTAMIQKSYSYKIPTNQNCPYKETCPLVPSVNMRDAMGRTPLHIAGEQGNKAVFNALITIGADKTIKDYRGLLPKI